MIVTWIFGGLLIWIVIGCMACAAVDDKQQTLLKWARECPLPGGSIWVVMAWPVIVLFEMKNRWNNPKH